MLKGKLGKMKSKQKKSNKDRDKGIVWCMAEIYAMKLAIRALQEQINDINAETPPQNPEQS